MRSLRIVVLFLGLFSCGAPASQKEVDQPNDFDSLNSKINNFDSSHSEETDFAKFDRPIDYDSIFNIKDYLVDDEIDTSKIQIIDSDCALFIYPSEEQIEEMGEGDYQTGTADYEPHLVKQMAICDSMGIRKEVANRQFIEFKNDDRYWLLDIRRKHMPKWNLILFKRNKSPLVPTSFLTTQLAEEYFVKRY